MLALAAPAHGAERAGSDRFRDVEADGTALQAQVEQLRVNFTERSGLIGVTEARERYEDAVYLFLIEDYVAAATSFYILVQSNALGNADLARDSEWYLAECLFQMDNYRTAEEAYRNIVDKGAAHPYFADAVRRAMEVQGILGDWASFDSFFTLYIESRRVPVTDLITYTLGKSYYRRGMGPLAKDFFGQVAPGTPYYSRARYFLGVVMVKEKNFPAAIEEFKRAEADPVTDEDHKAVLELTQMALARLYYETGDFPKSQEYYAKIPGESPHYADELYESVWTFIKQEKWNEALAQVDIFLLKYPAHRYTASMRTLQGHLHMKLQAYDNARTAYEAVVESYTPVVLTLSEVGDDPVRMRTYLDDVVAPTATTAPILPGYAQEILLARDEVGRAIGTWTTLRTQAQELTEAEALVVDLQAALAGENDVLGNFAAARNELAGIRGTALSLRNRLIESEGAWLKSHIPSSYKTALLEVQKERGAVFDALAEDQGSAGEREDRLQIYDEQVHEVQQRAFRLAQVAQEAQALGRGTIDYLDGGTSRLPADDAARVREDVAREQENLAGTITALDRLQSEVTRRQVLRTVATGATEDDSDTRRVVMQRYEALRGKLAGFRRYATDPDAAATFARIDRLWAMAESVERSADEAGRVLAVSEAREVTAVKSRLAQQVLRVAELRQEIDAQGADTEALAMRALGAGMASVADRFEEDVLLADKGIVDVYWLRKTGTSDEILALNSEQARLLRELDEQFRLVRENLQK